MTQPTFSIVTVTLNPGDDLAFTAESICRQTHESFEWIVKDGGSRPEQLAALDKVPKNRIRLVQSPDRGIFDAMNQAISSCTGKYTIFMNAGDSFLQPTTLAEIALNIEANPADLYYSNYYNRKWKTVIQYPSKLTRKYLYRRVPCHQAVITRTSTLAECGGFRSADYRIVGDHEIMYRLVFNKNLNPKFIPVTTCSYKDDGTHASKAGFARREEERRRLRREYFSLTERITWGMLYQLTLPRFRTWITLKCRGGRLSKIYLATMARTSALFNR